MKMFVLYVVDWHTETFGVPLDMCTVDEEDLAKKLGRFYCEAKPQPDQKYGKHTEYHINTMKSIRAAINRHLSDIGRNINIVNDKAFKVANKGLTGLLKRRLVTGTFRPTTHKEVIDMSDLQKITAFFENAYLSPINLRLAVWYIIAMNFVSRGLGFYYQLRIDSFDFKVDEEGSTYACLKREQKSRDYLDYNHITEAMYDKRIYETGNRNCPVKTLKFFLAKTDPNASYLFNKCLKDAICSPTICNLWYSNKHLNQGSFVSFLPDICKSAGCKRYTANCLRETAIHAGFEPRDIKYFSGHEYESSMQSYDREISKSASVTLYSMAENVGRVENDNADGPYESV